MSTLAPRLGDVPDETRQFAVLAGDLLVVSLVVAGGIVEHHGLAGLTDPFTTLETVIPFAVGWLLCAGIAGLYRPDVLTDPRVAARHTTLTALAAVNVGLLLRASPYFAGGTAWPFPLVMTGTVLVVVVPWRLVLVRLFGGE
ncbi:DUF3054 domain-containing protein [Natranaeroarchaeum aerophilus]|uniref:DUF3054 domain-containing protein n=1 Tax=Natranaeroarchaeum aerophilus TaxID=2917711 RepID=A0AAE3K4I5_9EURY|nr:DUF3054 domain-containing protein [Natranaeroarchaeum aerophilus]MCL9813176.1 DUF3054 domain-containing protein [Natranaeroarchaeum aerophilus]